MTYIQFKKSSKRSSIVVKENIEEIDTALGEYPKEKFIKLNRITSKKNNDGKLKLFDLTETELAPEQYYFSTILLNKNEISEFMCADKIIEKTLTEEHLLADTLPDFIKESNS